MKLDAMFVSAHPDDVELSCGGTVRKLVKSGFSVGIIDLTQGELGTRGSKELRKKETDASSKILGIHARENLKIPDGNIENTAGNRLKLINCIRYYRPEVIFIPYQNDRHPDHHNSNVLATEAAFYAGLHKLKSKRDGKEQMHFRPKRNYYFMQTYSFEPSFIIDITDEFEDKMKAIGCFSSQFFNPDSNEPETFISDEKFLGYIEAAAKYYGFKVGVKYGEPFYCEEMIKLLPEGLFI